MSTANEELTRLVEEQPEDSSHEEIYVLHVFQKKSKKKVATPKHELELMRARLKEAERRHEEYLREEGNHD